MEKTKERMKIYDVRIFPRPRKDNECSADTEQHSTPDIATALAADFKVAGVGIEPTTVADQNVQTDGSTEPSCQEQQKAGAENASYEWLMGILGKSPTKKLFSKPHLQKLALARWNALSERGFLRVWDKAVRDANAPAWSRSGRLEKSPHPLIAAPIKNQL
jgi:hypothetical protein